MCVYCVSNFGIVVFYLGYARQGSCGGKDGQYMQLGEKKMRIKLKFFKAIIKSGFFLL